jgi:2,4-dienoyl-CoA reductase-like NADH-dependent reductase (Old Yellow Enzyme family)
VSTAFESIRIGRWDLPQRFVMAPLTRNRAGEGQAPTELNAEYYGQRASAGLIITEGTQPSAVGQGYLDTPGMHSDEQVAGWRLVADAVHQGGGHVVDQLMHAGRVAHPDNKGGLESVAPSAIAAPGEIVTPKGQQAYAVPRALETDEIPALVAEFVHAARQAVAAGLDGVEVHAANGYLLQQFLADTTNHRDDAYGGSPEGRARLVGEVTRAVVDAVGAERVGIRLSPLAAAHEMAEADGGDTYRALAETLRPLGLAYVHLLAQPEDALTAELRSAYDAPLLLNTGFAKDTERAEAISFVADGHADASVVGRAFIANPDLFGRWSQDAEQNPTRADLFYASGPEGYTDYPTLAAAETSLGTA